MIWTLRKKILVGYSVVLALMIAVLIWSLLSLLGLGKASEAILRKNYRSILAADNMIGAIERQDSAILLIILGYDDEGSRQFGENESYFLQWLAKAKDNITEEGESQIINSIDAGYSHYLVSFSRLVKLYQIDHQRAARFYRDTVLPYFKSIRDGCVELREINQNAMFRVSDRAKYIATRDTWSMVIFGLIVILIGIGFSLALSTRLVMPLKQIMQATKKVAEGDYDVEAKVQSSDELGDLASEFNSMAKRLKEYNDMNIEKIVSEKQKGEAIIRSIDDGIIVVNNEFKIVNMNPTAARCFNVEPDKKTHLMEVIGNEKIFNYIKQCVESGQSPLIDEKERLFSVRQGETTKHYMFSIIPVQANPGIMLGVVLLLRDVTTLKELDRMKSEFIMMASHELRTPMTSIGMSIGLLTETAREKLTDREQQLLSIAYEETQSLKALVNDLLDLSKIEAGKIDIDFDRVPVAVLFEKSTTVLKSQTEEKSVDLSSEFLGNIPDVRADANKITWVLTNLISNALRYVGKGGHILLFAERLKDYVHISVSDDGEGIPYEYQSKIFDKFVQIKRDSNSGSSGLGLAICKEIVRAHGGTIWVESTPGKGTTFTFTLPVFE